MVAEGADEGVDAGGPGPVEGAGAGPVGAHGHHLHAVRRVGRRVEQGLQGGPAAGGQHDDARSGAEVHAPTLVGGVRRYGGAGPTAPRP